MRRDSRLILWSAEHPTDGAVRFYEEMTEEPIFREEWMQIFPVFMEVEWLGDVPKATVRLPKEPALALSRHFRQWYGGLLTESLVRSKLGAKITDEELKAAQKKYIEAQYELKTSEANYAELLFRKSRTHCGVCQGEVYLTVSGDWRHLTDVETVAHIPSPMYNPSEK